MAMWTFCCDTTPTVQSAREAETRQVHAAREMLDPTGQPVDLRWCDRPVAVIVYAERLSEAVASLEELGDHNNRTARAYEARAVLAAMQRGGTTIDCETLE